MRTNPNFIALTVGGIVFLQSMLASATLAPEALSLLRSNVQAEPSKAAAFVVRALNPVSAVGPHDAAAVTSTAIAALGPTPSTRHISSLVHAAVRTTPDYVLEIVRAAALLAPADAADEIAASAVAALPDPWRQILYRRAGSPVERTDLDYKNVADFKGQPDYKEPVAPDGLPMTLAEAVVQTVLDARSGLSAPGIYAAVEAVLRSAPGWLITAIYDPKGISGVGDAGLNNYANEPLRRRPPTLAPTPVTSVPATPPPVSR